MAKFTLFTTLKPKWYSQYNCSVTPNRKVGKKVQKNMQVFINSTETYMRTTTIHPNNSRKGSQNSCSCNISMQIKSTCSNKQSNLLWKLTDKLEHGNWDIACLLPKPMVSSISRYNTSYFTHLWHSRIP